MADRFPLIVNAVSKKIEELISGDSLDLTGSGIAIGGSNGTNGQYLKTDGSTVLYFALYCIQVKQLTWHRLQLSAKSTAS